MFQKLLYFTALIISSLNLNSQTKPIAETDSFYFYRNTWAYFPVLRNDYDKDSNDKITLLDIITNPKHGTAILDIPRDYIKYTSDSSYVGFDSLEYSIIDKSGLKDTAKVYFNNHYGLSIAENEANTTFIYPNPAKEKLVVQNLLNRINTYFVLTDLSGRKIQEIIFEGNEKTVSLEDLENGIYIVNVRDEKRNILLNQKIVKE